MLGAALALLAAPPARPRRPTPGPQKNQVLVRPKTSARKTAARTWLKAEAPATLAPPPRTGLTRKEARTLLREYGDDSDGYLSAAERATATAWIADLIRAAAATDLLATT